MPQQKKVGSHKLIGTYFSRTLWILLVLKFGRSWWMLGRLVPRRPNIPQPDPHKTTHSNFETALSSRLICDLSFNPQKTNPVKNRKFYFSFEGFETPTERL